MGSVTLKDDYTFLVSDSAGELVGGVEGFGMYQLDTRYLSRLELTVNGEKPHPLSFTTDYKLAANFRLSARHRKQIENVSSALAPAWSDISHAIGVTRQRFIRRGLVEIIEFINYYPEPIKISCGLLLGVDFCDIFEVRGFVRENQSYKVESKVLSEGQVVNFRSLPNPGQVGTSRNLRFECKTVPSRYELLNTNQLSNGTLLPEVLLTYDLELLPHQPLIVEMHLTPDPAQPLDEISGELVRTRPAVDFPGEIAQMRQLFTAWQESCTRLETNDYLLNRIFESATLDLRSLMQQQAGNLVVTAGLPWYFTLFGRDSLITALETLSLNPQIAVDTLRGLAVYQATDFDDWRDSEPGKILHELRLGDMTLSGEMPHGPYYGSVDSTLLFILCFAETQKRLNDAALFTELWPAVEKALQWAEEYGELDRDGYIKFKRRSKRGILHQGWKDSDESMGGVIGPRPSLPLALVEVQGYYYAALIALAETLRHFGDARQLELATRLEAKAAQLKINFNRDFWWEEEGFFAQALDGQNQLVRNITSNPGHCLWSGIVDEAKAALVVQRLMQPDMLCGWGIRTMSQHDPTYNPMSYHNGSIWPHDNALIIAGLRRYQFDREALQVATQILEAASTFEEYRLPELYCGFGRNITEGQLKAPAAYPVSCSPQAWAAGTPALLIQTLLGLEVNAYQKTILVAPILANNIQELKLTGLWLGHHRLDLWFTRDPDTGYINLAPAPNSASTEEDITVGLQLGFADRPG